MNISNHFKVFFCAVGLFSSFNSFAKEQSFIEAGLGVEYGGLGVQIYLPLNSDYFDFYVAGGLFSYSTETNGEFGAGIGGNYFLSKNSSIGLYGGVINVDKVTDYNTLDYSTDTDLGGAINYQYHLSGNGEAGFVFGVSYSFYDGGSYPFVSLGYRF